MSARIAFVIAAGCCLMASPSWSQDQFTRTSGFNDHRNDACRDAGVGYTNEDGIEFACVTFFFDSTYHQNGYGGGYPDGQHGEQGYSDGWLPCGILIYPNENNAHNGIAFKASEYKLGGALGIYMVVQAQDKGSHAYGHPWLRFMRYTKKAKPGATFNCNSNGFHTYPYEINQIIRLPTAPRGGINCTVTWDWDGKYANTVCK